MSFYVKSVTESDQKLGTQQKAFCWNFITIHNLNDQWMKEPQFAVIKIDAKIIGQAYSMP